MSLCQYSCWLTQYSLSFSSSQRMYLCLLVNANVRLEPVCLESLLALLPGAVTRVSLNRPCLLDLLGLETTGATGVTVAVDVLFGEFNVFDVLGVLIELGDFGTDSFAFAALLLCLSSFRRSVSNLSSSAVSTPIFFANAFSSLRQLNVSSANCGGQVLRIEIRKERNCWCFCRKKSQKSE
jgi:hypothetical protein